MGLYIDRVITWAMLIVLTGAAFHTPINGQDLCPIQYQSGVSNYSSEGAATRIFQESKSYTIDWTSSKDTIASVNLPGRKLSSNIQFTNLGLLIPEGATIDGIQVTFEGQSEGQGYIADNQVRLIGGSQKSENKAGQGYSTQRVWSRNLPIDKWNYGRYDDTWGLDWTAQEINASTFGVELRIRNILNQPISATVVNVNIEIFYTAAPTFCSNECPSFYVDKDAPYDYYQWHIPEGFEATSIQGRYIIDLHGRDTTASGVYELCVDAYNDDVIISNCCIEYRFISCQKASISGKTWQDVDADGLFTNIDLTIGNVEVRLLDRQGQVVRSTRSSNNGNYSFDDLEEGVYIIEFSTQNGLFTLSNQGQDEGIDSDVTGLFGVGTTDFITVQAGVTISDIDAGYETLVEMTGLVWEDLNVDGQYDPTEPKIEGVEVVLFDDADRVLAISNTSSDGMYQFDNLRIGEYKVRVIADSTLFPTLRDEGDDSTDSDIDNQFETALFTIGVNGRDDVFAGLVKLGSIAGIVWEDKDCDGSIDADEDRIDELMVHLRTNSQVIQTVLSEDGTYEFNDLYPGNYEIKVAYIQKYIATVDSNDNKIKLINNELLTDEIILNSGTSLNDIHLGLVTINSDICGNVWWDEMYDGIRGADETNTIPLTMILHDEQGLSIDTTLSNIDGTYCFTDKAPGAYTITASLPDSLIISPYQITQDSISNDFLSPSNTTAPITLTSEKDIDNIDLGFGILPSIGDFVWNDINQNGIQDSDELGRSAIIVNLYNDLGDLIESTVTDSEGQYFFQYIQPQLVYVEIELSDEFTTIVDSGLDDGLDSDVTNAFGSHTTDIYDLQVNTNDFTIDFGVIENKGSICGQLWIDSNTNGIREVNEPNLGDGIRIEAMDAMGMIVGRAITDDAGSYCITGLTPGLYILSITDLPSFYQATEQNVGADDAIDSDFDRNLITSPITLPPGTILENVDFGATLKSNVGDFVWMDLNQDGLQNMGEPGVEGVVINLLDDGGVTVQTTMSAADGFYLFTDIRLGDYQIQFIAPSGLQFTMAGVDPDLGSDADSTGLTPIFSLSPNMDNLSVDAGLITPRGSISGLAWEDLNENGIREFDEKFIAGVNVLLTNATMGIIESTFTDSMGTYSFTDIDVGEYVIQFDSIEGQPYTLPNRGNDDTVDSDVTSQALPGSTDIIILGPGEQILHVDAGYQSLKSTIKGIAFYDEDGDGLFNNNDTLFNDLAVYLLDQDSNTIDSTFTDSEGAYQFNRIDFGRFMVSFDIDTTCFGPTLLEIGMDSSINSNVIDETATLPIDIDSASMVCGINGGFFGYSMISGMAFIDEDRDGLQGAMDIGFNGIEVCLRDGQGDIIIKDTTRTINGIEGSYVFNRVPPGQSFIHFTRPMLYSLSPKDVGSDDSIDSDVALINDFEARSDTFILISKSKVEHVDFGLYFDPQFNSMVAGAIWYEEDIDGLRASTELLAEGLEIVLFNDKDEVIDLMSTDVNGSFQFTNLQEGMYYMTVEVEDDEAATFLTVGNDPTIDNDFTMIDDEVRTPMFYLGVTTDSMNVDLGIATALNVGNFVWEDQDFNGIQDTGEPGLEGIEVTLREQNDLLVLNTITTGNGFYEIDRVPAGNYIIEVTIPDTMSATKQNQGSDPLLDSDIDLDGISPLFNLSGGGSADTLDAGLVRNASVGDYIWIDFNGDGQQDNDEPGQSGFRIELYDANNNLIAIDTSHGDMTIDAGGQYMFNNIRPGDYYLVFELQGDFMYTTPNASVDEMDSDVTSSITFGSTDLFTLSPGQEDMDRDCGIFLPGAIGDYAWRDLNENGLQDPDEPGIEGVPVRLLRSTGAVVALDTTDADGRYLFTGLRQGLYSIRFGSVDGLEITLQDVGNDDDIDSDANPSNGNTPLISLAHGAMFSGADCGFIEDTNANGHSQGEFTSTNQENTNPQFATINIVPHPNPAVFETTLDLGMSGAFEFTMMSTEGRIVKNEKVKTLDGIIRLDLRSLDPGIYRFVFKNSTGYYYGNLLRVY